MQGEVAKGFQADSISHDHGRNRQGKSCRGHPAGGLRVYCQTLQGRGSAGKNQARFFRARIVMRRHAGGFSGVTSWREDIIINEAIIETLNLDPEVESFA